MTLRDLLRIAWRRKVLLLVTAMVVPLTAAALSLRSTPSYDASAQVVLTQQDLGSLLEGLPNASGTSGDPQRDAETQASVALAPQIANAAVAEAKPGGGMTGDDLLAASNVTAADAADILTFDVIDKNPARAARLVNAYAHQYTVYRANSDASALQAVINSVQKKLATLDAAGEKGSALYSAYEDRFTQLSTLVTLQQPAARVFQQATADSASQSGSKVERNIVLGLIVGLVLGFALAFLLESLDTRVRSGEEVAERLGLPLLARVPEPPKPLRDGRSLVMVDLPASPDAEVFRLLRANVEFANVDYDARVIAVTSAKDGEGKSTTAANLAVASALAGKRVCLVDLDFRSPTMDRLFHLEGRAGLTDVVLGVATLDDAIHEVGVGVGTAPSILHGAGSALLDVVPAGPVPSTPGELILSQPVANVLAELRGQYDVVIVDSPPLLLAGDALALSARVDAMLLVVDIRSAKRPVLQELRRILSVAPVPRLGVVATGAEEDDAYEPVSGRRYGPREPEPIA
jgi:capsular exopolysaccharide synthesis family protein